MNRSAFYASVRQRASGIFGTFLSQAQVEGVEAILDGAERRGTPLKHLAYILATANHESAHTMQAVRETLAKTDDGAMRALESAWKAGKLKWVTTPYWRKDADGKSWFVRGLVQITHRANYQKLGMLIGVDLIGYPSKALELSTAVQILFVGMELGRFTGKALSDYIKDGKADYVGARRIVNGTDKADLIAGYAKASRRLFRTPATLPAQRLMRARLILLLHLLSLLRTLSRPRHAETGFPRSPPSSSSFSEGKPHDRHRRKNRA